MASFIAPALAVGVPTAGAAGTGSCADVATGATVPSAGPNRATVVVDTGDGPVWSACISFSGTITGAKALELARTTITDLDPVYELYGGEGAAVCVLRGVGNQPPDCLSKTIEYWKYFRDGRYSAGGAGQSKVGDGAVEAWRWGGPGATPRPATAGTRAVAGAPVTTTTTTTAPSGSGGGSGTTTVPAHVGATGSSGATSTVPGATATRPGPDGSVATTAVAGTSGALGATLDAPGGSGSGGDDESASAASASGAPVAAGGAVDGSSGTTTVFGVLGALAVIGGLGVLARRRRRPVGS